MISDTSRDNSTSSSSSNGHWRDVRVDEPEQIHTPRNEDVLLGRGATYQQHPGNVRYTALIHQHRETYFASNDSWAKKLIVCGIVDDVWDTGGRFLKRVVSPASSRGAQPARWTSVSNDAARLKVAHALQYRRRKILYDASLFDYPEPLSPPSPLNRVWTTPPTPPTPPSYLPCSRSSSDDGSNRLDNDEDADLEPIRLSLVWNSNDNSSDSSTNSDSSRSTEVADIGMSYATQQDPDSDYQDNFGSTRDAMEPSSFDSHAASLLSSPYCYKASATFDFSSLCLNQVLLASQPNPPMRSTSLLLRSSSIGSFDPLDIGLDEE